MGGNRGGNPLGAVADNPRYWRGLLACLPRGHRGGWCTCVCAGAFIVVIGEADKDVVPNAVTATACATPHQTREQIAGSAAIPTAGVAGSPLRDAFCLACLAFTLSHYSIGVLPYGYSIMRDNSYFYQLPMAA